MCEPISASMAMYAAVGSTAFAALGAFQQMQSQKAMLHAQATQAQHDAELSEAQARRESERGDREAQRLGAQVADFRAKQAAAFGASGTDLNFGSAKGTLDQTDYYGLQDQTTISRNALDADYALRDKARWGRAGVAFTNSRADSINPWLSATGSLLGNSGMVADRWNAYAKS